MKKKLLILIFCITLLIVISFLLVLYFMCGQVVDFTITSLPNKTTYYVNDNFELNGISFMGYKRWSKYNIEISIDDVDIMGFDSSKVTNSQTIIVKYKKFTDQFNITIKDLPEANKIVSKLEVIPQEGYEIKTNYHLFEVLDVLHMRLKVYYTDGTNEILEIASMNDGKVVLNPDIIISGYDNRELAKNLEVRIIYQSFYVSIYVNIVES